MGEILSVTAVQGKRSLNRRKAIANEDVLEWVAARVRRESGALKSSRLIDISDMIDELGGMTTEQEILERVQVCVSRAWLERSRTKGVSFDCAITDAGIEHLDTIRQQCADEAALPWLERQLRKKTTMWGVTISTIVQVVTLGIALVGLIVAIVALAN